MALALNILIQNRPDCFLRSGGDTIQMIKTAEYLRKLGAAVEVDTSACPDLSRYDIVHIFNLAESSSFHQARNATRQKKPVALTPIYWHGGELRLRALACITREGLGLSLGREMFRPDQMQRRLASITASRRRAREVLSSASVILPNSAGEAWQLCQDFSLTASAEAKFFVVPNGIDPELFFPDLDGPRAANRVLMVSRFDLRKNQLSLIRALKGSGVKPAFVGGPTDMPLSNAYYARCRSVSEPGALFLGNKPHEALRGVYNAFQVHVMPSFYETPGLSTLEAAACGCTIVSTNRGSAHEYLGKFAFYCEPTSASSIMNTVKEALSAPDAGELSSLVRTRYSWKNVAASTMKVYEQVMEEDSERRNGEALPGRALCLPLYEDQSPSLLSGIIETSAT